MTSNRDNDALSWGGENDPTLAPDTRDRSASRGRPVPENDEKSGQNGASVDESGMDKSGLDESGLDESGLDGLGLAGSDASADDGQAIEPGPADVAGSARLVFLGILAGFYLLYTLGWFIGASRIPGPIADDPVASFMFTLGTWLAVAAPIAWFGTCLLLTGDRPRVRLAWLIIGVVVLAPLPFVFGVNA